MRYEIITIFPEAFPGPLACGVIGKALSKEIISLKLHNLRDFSLDKNRAVDDVAYGGGGGMVFYPQPLISAIRSIRKPGGHAILLTPSGNKLTHKRAEALSKFEQLILVCGRYEGVDQRVIDLEIDEEISIGDFVLTGGEIPSMILIETVSRFLPGVIGNEESPKQESFVDGLLEYPHYTRPAVFEGKEVPEILRSGDHKKIAEWRMKESLKKTKENRPDLLQPEPACRSNARHSEPQAKNLGEILRAACPEHRRAQDDEKREYSDTLEHNEFINERHTEKINHD